MEDEKLRKILIQLDKECEGMDEEEKETYYRLRFMELMSTGLVEISDARRRSHTTCKRIMKSLGYSDIEAEIHCTQYAMKDEEERKTDRSDFNLLFVDEIKEIGSDKGREGVGEGLARETPHAVNISLRKFTSLIKVLKSKMPLKFKHMALGPFPIDLPMKNINRLQTKIERLITEEGKFLTAEQQAARSAYALFMKKDSEEMILEEAIKAIKNLIEENKDKSDDEKEDLIFDYLSKPSYEKINVVSSALLDNEKINDKMNNIIKAPIILAREMVQEYHFINDDGTERVEKHFKPYEELKRSINGLKKLFMIVEHKDSWEMGDTIGCVQELKADDSIRGIRGMGYFVESKLPISVKNMLKEKKPIQVSIGFMADLGGSGTFSDKSYDFTQRNIVLDHLAICLDSIARCALDKCGVNVENEITTDAQDITIINNQDYYYNISNIITKNDQEQVKRTNIEEESIGDSMTEDSFPDPKSGEAAGDLPSDLDLFLTGIRKYMNGATAEEARLTKEEILALFEKKGGKIMDEKEFEDAIALKDEKIKELEDIIRKGKVAEIKSQTDKYQDAELEKMPLKELSIIADAVFRFAPSQEKPPVIPVVGKDKEEFDKSVEDSKTKRIDPKEMFAETKKDFLMIGF